MKPALGPDKRVARHGGRRAGLGRLQVRFAIGLTGEEYVEQRAWHFATLERCPLHPEGGCGFARHGFYVRVSPWGCLIVRYYCPRGHITFSLLPDFLCSRLTGTLHEVEAVVAAVEAASSWELASEAIRPDIELAGALRWMRRRVKLVRAGLTAVIGLLPVFFVGCKPTAGSFRSVLKTDSALVSLRSTAEFYLCSLPPVLGFGPRPLRRRARSTGIQQETGPDPPSA